jgi:iron complex transport system ATP-binding protein
VSAALLSARGVRFRYREAEVLAGLDLDLREGEIVVLLGPNGAGKSTLLKVLSGLLSPDAGEVSLLGRPPASYGRREMARILSVVGQDLPVDFPMSVEEYVALGRYPHQGLFGGSTTEDREQTERALAMAGLEELRRRGLGEISAGERQMAAVARAICQGAKAMLLDEPTAFLDLHHRVAFYEIVTRLSRECGIGALVASHDLSLCAEYGERLLLLSAGRVIAAGAPEEVLTPENLRNAYGIAVACDRNPATGAVRVTPLRAGGRQRTGKEMR